MRTSTEANMLSRTAIVVGSTSRLASRVSKAKQAAVDRAVAVRPGPLPPYREQKRTATRKDGKMCGFSQSPRPTLKSKAATTAPMEMAYHFSRGGAVDIAGTMSL